MKDITIRALEMLVSCDLVLAEDTRVTAKILYTYGIKVPVQSFYSANEKQKTSLVLDRLRKKQVIVLVSDSGMPCFSDPGSFLVREVRSEGFPIYVVPGANAAISALVLSGCADRKSLFMGFLSPKKGRLKKALLEYEGFEGVIVIYESVHRVQCLLVCIEEIFGNIDVFIARELTKKFEESSWKTVSEWQTYLTRQTLKGEFTIILNK